MAAQDYIRQDAWDPFIQALRAGGNWQTESNRYVDAFGNSMKRFLGPTAGLNADNVTKFIQEAGIQGASGPRGLTYSELQNLSDQYVQNAYQDQATNYQKQQQTKALGESQTMVDDLIKKQSEQAVQQLTNPNTVNQLSKAYNSLGLGQSGAYEQGIADRLANATSGNISQALGAVTLPSVQNIQGLTSQPYGNFMNNFYGLQNQQSDMANAGLQQRYASQMGQMMQPSGFEKGLGYANTASSIIGNAGKAAGPLSTATSYVCKELIRRGLLCESDMDEFHIHIMPAMFKKARAFWKYAVDGEKLVNAVNQKGLDWKAFKPLLFDRVLEEKDPCKAVDLYADACHQLCISSDRSLWDERVMRTSVLDSLPFLPLLFAYQPFREALAKCIRVKMLFIYDKPKCEVHHGRS